MMDIDKALFYASNAQTYHAAAYWELEEMRKALDAAPTQPQPIVFVSPVTGKVETGANVWGSDWFDATGYGERYQSRAGVYSRHTGVDLNLPGFADAGKPAYAVADGEIVYSAAVAGWQALVVVIKHTREDGSNIWTRYAHIKNAPALGPVKGGDVIGYIADYTPLNKPEGDHLHFDAARIDLGAKPSDWPGDDLARVMRDYIDPATLYPER